MLVCPHNVIDYVDTKPKQVAKATADFDLCGISEGSVATCVRRSVRGSAERRLVH